MTGHSICKAEILTAEMRALDYLDYLDSRSQSSPTGSDLSQRCLAGHIRFQGDAFTAPV